MSDSYGAFCSDFYINQRLNLKMDLPADRETVLGMFDRVRREFPTMDRFRRASSELVLESDAVRGQQQWVALRKNSVRSGFVNPEAPKAAYALHRLTLDIAPYFLSISPLDVDFVEIHFGFDLLAGGNHDQIIFDALIAPTPLGKIFDLPGARPVDCQPILGVAITDSADLQAFVEVKTRTPGGPGSPMWRGDQPEGGGEQPSEPISVLLTMRRYGAVAEVAELKSIHDALASEGEKLLQSRVLPNLILPIREAIASNNA